MSEPVGLARNESSFLDCVIHESMRILPASAYSQRVSQRDLTLGDFHLPDRSIVVFSQFMTHRNERIFPRPAKFEPDRWQSIRPGTYEYLPFGAGPRLCIGAALATSILRTVLPIDSATIPDRNSASCRSGCACRLDNAGAGIRCPCFRPERWRCGGTDTDPRQPQRPHRSAGCAVGTAATCSLATCSPGCVEAQVVGRRLTQCSPD